MTVQGDDGRSWLVPLTGLFPVDLDDASLLARSNETPEFHA
jgi:hypothetical protein